VSESDAVGLRAPARRVADRYWIVAGVRALVALAVAAVVTFSPDHSEAVGHAAFGALAIGVGVAVLGGAIGMQTGITRALFGAHGILDLALGVVALLTPQAGPAFLTFLVSAWGVITGALELYLGARARRSAGPARDWMFAGGLSVLLAVVVLVVPPDYSRQFGGLEHVTGTLTGVVIVVGVLGAYAAVLGVYLAIAALSLRWSRGIPASTAPEKSR
jgi:uncharacterized membrane protein HdeD (DUF308 family)